VAKNSKCSEHNNIVERENVQRAKPPTKPSKQRKMLYCAPAHVRHKLFAAHMSPELRGAHIVKNLPVRTGDTVRIMRGDHKGLEGKVSRIDRQKYRIYLEGLTREKVDGTTIFVPIHPSKVMITHLNLDDKWRKKVLDKKKEAWKKLEKIPKKPRAKPEEKPTRVSEIVAPEEKEVAKEKPPKKKVALRKRKTVKKAALLPKRAKKVTEKPKKEEKPEAGKKRKTRRKTAKKTEEGGK
jgi:large subunit ribosomal protein L24